MSPLLDEMSRDIPVIETGRWKATAFLDKWDDYDKSVYVARKSGKRLDDLLKADFVHYGVEPDLQEVHPGNVLIYNGMNQLLSLLLGLGGIAFDSTHGRIGVGSGSTTNGSNATVTGAAADTGLVAATQSANNYYKIVDSAPTIQSVSGGTTNAGQWVATYATGVANFVWQEWLVDNAGTGATANGGTGAQSGNPTGTNYSALNHKGVNLGTKTSASTWTLTVQVQLS